MYLTQYILPRVYTCQHMETKPGSYYLVANGDVSALPAVVLCSLHTVFTEGFVRDRNTLGQLAVL